MSLEIWIYLAWHEVEFSEYNNDSVIQIWKKIKMMWKIFKKKQISI